MSFDVVETPLAGLLLVHSHAFSDDRGFFRECYKESDFRRAGITDRFTQDNHSFSHAGVVRGLHFQHAPAAQAKLVRVVQGTAWDVAVDLRPDSTTFLEWYAAELSGENGRMLYLPAGFAHGFAAMTAVHLTYKCSNEYAPALDAGVRWNDPRLAISWPVADPLLSPKDAGLPTIAELGLAD